MFVYTYLYTTDSSKWVVTFSNAVSMITTYYVRSYKVFQIHHTFAVKKVLPSSCDAYTQSRITQASGSGQV